MNHGGFKGQTDWGWKPDTGNIFSTGDQSHKNCVECGWPIKSTAIKAGRTEEGSMQYKHSLCPSTRQRAAMRAAVYANA